jgi:2-oxoisovalerate dehydrogenase E2 component (dihydrolipoyl transacylase)
VQTAAAASSAAPEIVPVARSNSIMTPAVRHLLKEHNLSAADLPGSGKDGRILKEDVQRYLSELEPHPSTLPAQPTPLAQASVEDQRITLTPIQTSMSKVMTASLSIPHSLYSHSVDVTGLNKVRRQLNTYKNILAASGESMSKITALPFVLKAIPQTFKQFPTINSHYDSNHKELLLKGSHNFGIAMDTPRGLLVPVVRNVETHTMFSLSMEIERLGKLAKSGNLAPNDLTGVTFTVSNIGSIGGDVVSPVIVPPQVGIVAIGVCRMFLHSRQVPLEQKSW